MHCGKPGLEVFQVLQNVWSEWLQHVSLDILGWEEGDQTQGDVSCSINDHRQLGFGVCATAGQADFEVRPRGCDAANCSGGVCGFAIFGLELGSHAGCLYNHQC